MIKCEEQCPEVPLLKTTTMKEKVNHPGYYQFGKSEVIDIARELTYNCGVALAYVARSGRADDSLIKVEEGMTPNQKRIEDFQKAIFHLQDEIKRLKGDTGIPPYEQQDY